MAEVARGRLVDPSRSPERGERVEELARVRHLVVEQILSGELDGAKAYLQDQDEFVVVLAGSAVLEVQGQQLELAVGDWLLLPGGTPHQLLRTQRGTSWLAVHLHDGADVTGAATDSSAGPAGS